jgi:DNA-binding transcriptional LysR family regulator
VELRQLRYFVAVAEELHFTRAAQRLYISGPALSQQIIALERDLGVELFVRDRRGVALTDAGRSLLADARSILAMADDARARLVNAAAANSPLRLGYVSWLPDDINAILGSSTPLRIDEWILPSHAQVDRVAEGTLDLAVARVGLDVAQERQLTAHLLRAESLSAVGPGTTSTKSVAAQRVTVLLDADESAWSSWNRFAEAFSDDTGAKIARIDDGGIAGEAFYSHVRRIGGAVLATPKRHAAVCPPSLGQRPVAEPVPLWTWSLLHRADDDRVSVRDAVTALLSIASIRDWCKPPERPWWVPLDDPHRGALELAR